MEERQDGSYQIHMRLRLRRGGTVVYGSGVSELLCRCESTRSLHAAAKEMRMPYRKALQIVARAEQELGQPILKKTIGGAGGGGSRLTEYGRALVTGFQALEAEVAEYAARRLRHHLPDLSLAGEGPAEKQKKDPPSGGV